MAELQRLLAHAGEGVVEERQPSSGSSRIMARSSAAGMTMSRAEVIVLAPVGEAVPSIADAKPIGRTGETTSVNASPS